MPEEELVVRWKGENGCVMRDYGNSNGVPSQIGLPQQPMGVNARTLIGLPAFLRFGTESAKQISWKISA
jgi:hypothetical protein